MDPRILLTPLLNEKIADLLTEYPQLTTYFLKQHAACIGCGFSSFCNLGDAVRIYGLDIDYLMKEIQQYVRTIIQTN